MRASREILRDAERVYDFLAGAPAASGKADLILAAGSHDLRVADHAAELWLRGAAPRIVCSGGLGKITDGLWQEPEAVLFARRCRARGVPDDALILERRARNTGENFALSRELVYGLGLRPAVGFIVCKPYMGLRAWAAACRQWPELAWSAALPPIPFAGYENSDCPLEQEIPLMVGDLQRLRVYAERGFQVPVEVPEEIREAGRRLVRAGYDRFVLREEPAAEPQAGRRPGPGSGAGRGASGAGGGREG